MATTTAPAAGGSVTGWLYVLALLAYVGVLAWVALGRPPLRASLLHTVMTASQATARTVGVVGLRAEAAYRRTVSPTGEVRGD